MNHIEKYYNKFNEDKRLKTRHGIVELTITMHYIHKYLKKGDKILDIGAGTGAYSIPLSKEGYDITAVELVKQNVVRLKEKNSSVKAYQGNALNLSKFKDESFDFVLLFGPMYHLFSTSDKLKALSEAKRVLKKDGKIMVAYLLNNYAIIKHGFIDNNIRKSLQENKIDKHFNILNKEEDLYSYISLKEINKLNKLSSLKRVKIISPDGPTDYIRREINNLTEEDFKLFINFQLQNCEDKSLLGASSHIVDILVKK